ncbi:hypothetical protein NP493_1259g00035 [Ridgeia piscesae]|uniref:Lipase maturation factor 2 n=1 Tax=Ridgeia piscesae TaxID=27915 RepID=A0AAD9KBV4_RIDPI|nr:hypothetical protein NP493_1259g00035 [Ridgeia piscesae]
MVFLVRERNDLPIVDWLAKTIRWVCNIVVYGGLFYWTVKLFGLHIKTNPFSIESTTMFDANDLDKFLKASVPVCIWIGVFSLGWEILAAIVNQFVQYCTWKAYLECCSFVFSVDRRSYLSGSLTICSFFKSLRSTIRGMTMPDVFVFYQSGKCHCYLLESCTIMASGKCHCYLLESCTIMAVCCLFSISLVCFRPPTGAIYCNRATDETTTCARGEEATLSEHTLQTDKFLWLVSQVDFTEIEQQSYQNVWPVLHRWHAHTNRFHMTSSYGLFRMMTGVGGRPEVIIEGSDYLEKGWKEYEFLYKPGNVSRRPPIVAPHQPRLDWQMWFAALGSYNHNPWLVNLVYRLLNNQPEVLALMGKNPFPNKPPKYIRANLYHYHYTQKDPSHQWYSKSDWWVREKKKKSKRSKKRSKAFIPDFLEWFVQKLRSFLGQTSGFTFVVSLVMTGLVLNLLKPSLKSV